MVTLAMAHYITNLPKSKKNQYFIYLKPTLFLWATHKIKEILLVIFLLKSILNMWFFNIGSIHNWGTKKECLTKKGLEKTTLNFF
jgi:hypothetical protein